MLVQLGPVESKQMEGWLRFARRVLCDLRTEPGDMGTRFSQNLLTEWNRLIDQWSRTKPLGDETHDNEFIWRGDVEPDKAEYLLHSLQRALHSATVAAWVTPDDLANHGFVTYHIMQRFIDALDSEGIAHEEFVEQLRSEIARFGASLTR
ncbi:MAG: hypothetical protein ACN4GZ_01525 [Acidimicrobiales bacterium]